VVVRAWRGQPATFKSRHGGGDTVGLRNINPRDQPAGTGSITAEFCRVSYFVEIVRAERPTVRFERWAGVNWAC